MAALDELVRAARPLSARDLAKICRAQGDLSEARRWQGKPMRLDHVCACGTRHYGRATTKRTTRRTMCCTVCDCGRAVPQLGTQRKGD
ncbi:hypothetical protein LCGC14_1813760, partial [marine sediment metagenome]